MELELLGGDEAELTSLVSAFVKQRRRLPGYDDLVAMRARLRCAAPVHCGDREVTRWVS